MADKTPQTQTTATPAASSPEARGASADAAASTAAKTETKRSLNASIEAAFAAAEIAPETDAPQATRGRDNADTTTETEDDVVETESEDTATETEAEETEAASDDEAIAEETDAPESETDAEPEDDLQDDPKAPKGIRRLIKRYNKKNAEVKELRAELDKLQSRAPITIAPTPASPLADVDTLDDLTQRLSDAKAIKAWAKENPEGQTITRNGREIEITPEQVQARLAQAEAVIESYADRKIALTERAAIKPWETAEKIVPGLLKPNTEENRLYVHLLSTCPEIKERFNDHELVLAYAIKGFKIANEEASGKAKYVRMELGKDGKPIVPTGSKTAVVKPKPKAPASPQGNRPALQTGAATKRTREEVIAALPPALRKDPEARLRALIENAEAA